MSAYHRTVPMSPRERSRQPGSSRGLGLLVAAAIVGLAACGSSTATATPTPPGPTPAPPTEPFPTDLELPSFALPSFVGDAELEAMFPDDVGGQPVVVRSMAGTELPASGMGTQLQAVLDALGKEPADLSVAFGAVGNVTIIAFRVKGVAASAIFPALVTAYQQEISPNTSEVTIADKQVTKFTPLAPGGDVTYVYLAGDTVFTVGGTDVTDATLAEIFSKLP
jgi:hypothetical protein